MSYLIDLHIHTSRYSSCAQTLDPFQIELFGLKAGLDGVVLAEHDARWESEQFKELEQHNRCLKLFNGMELTTAGNFHLILIGSGDTAGLKKGIEPEQAIELVHRQGGVVILAHPFRTAVPPLRVLENVDAIEIGSTSFNADESRLSRVLARELDKPVVCSSDAHALERIGWGYTEFPEAPQDEAQLCAMIKGGFGKPVLPHAFFRS